MIEGDTPQRCVYGPGAVVVLKHEEEPVLESVSLFTEDEVVKELNKDGFERGTIEFTNELCNRYRVSDTDPTMYCEREDWDGTRNSQDKGIIIVKLQ